MTQLKRVARYLKGVPRKALQQPSQEPSSAHLEVHVDSGWAGDTGTRRSTFGVIVRRGLYLLKHSSTENVIGLSGAESEYHALTKGGCSGLGLESLFAHWNLKLQLSLHMESSSAKAVVSRRGAGKSTRHIQTSMLWPQERVAAKHLRVVESGNGIKSCRHLDAKIGETEPHAKTVDKKLKVSQEAQESHVCS